MTTVGSEAEHCRTGDPWTKRAGISSSRESGNRRTVQRKGGRCFRVCRLPAQDRTFLRSRPRRGWLGQNRPESRDIHPRIVCCRRSPGLPIPAGRDRCGGRRDRRTCYCLVLLMPLMKLDGLALGIFTNISPLKDVVPGHIFLGLPHDGAKRCPGAIRKSVPGSGSDFILVPVGSQTFRGSRPDKAAISDKRPLRSGQYSMRPCRLRPLCGVRSSYFMSEHLFHAPRALVTDCRMFVRIALGYRPVNTLASIMVGEYCN